MPHVLPPPRRRAFTMVELLVVIAIVGILVAILLPSVTGAFTRAEKTREAHRLRQLGIAWTTYATVNGDGILPGHLAPEVQQAWGVRYRFPDGSIVPPAGELPDELAGTDENLAGHWVWRLAPYFGYDADLLLGYLGDDAKIEDGPLGLQARPHFVRDRPAYGYNAFHMGGWWTASGLIFRNAMDRDTRARVSVVSTSLGAVKRPSGVIAFASSALREPGIHKYVAMRDDRDGAFLVVPPWLGALPVWGLPEDEQLAAGHTIRCGSVNQWWEDFRPPS